MEFVSKKDSVFSIGSCVSVGKDISSMFSIGSCVSSSEEKTEDEHLPKLEYEGSQNWIVGQRYAKEYDDRDPYFTGPTDESNWLFRKTPGSKYGAFAVGGYPDKPNYFEYLKRAGLDTFVCLNSEYGFYSKGDYYPRYGDTLPKDRFVHVPIEDMQTIDEKIIVRLAEDIVRRITNGENVYLHCAGGHGRTGTVALVVLHMLYPKLTYIELFEFVQYAHDQREGNFFGNSTYVYKMTNDHLANKFVKGQVPSPQTIEQRTQVRKIINRP
jgi:protein-tyrosine phosphatase